MKLLSPEKAKNTIRKENEELLDSNIRLRKNLGIVISNLNTAKTNYDPEKVRALNKYKAFLRDLDEKVSKRLEELAIIEARIEQKKDVYYGFIEKQDALEERVNSANEREKKLDLREQFISGIEEKVWMTGKKL